ncbi:MAG: diguanylate cyclase [Acidobacteriota bacterium]
MAKRDWIRGIAAFCLPGGALLLLLSLMVRAGLLTAWWPAAAPYVSGTVLIAATLLAWRFGRSRALYALMAIALTQLLLERLGMQAFGAAALLLPLNLAAAGLLRERGVMSRSGLLRLTALLLQPALAAAALLLFPRAGERFLLGRFSSSEWLAQWGLPQPALAAFAVAAVALCVGYGIRRSAQDSAFIWALAGAFLALDSRGSGPLPALYLTAAALIVGLSVVETSHRLAYRDELTGLPGRRALEEALASVGGRTTVAMVDVDHFKRFNDRYGHDAGDQVLKMVAARLSEAGGGGQAFRYGGEEFTILFRGCGAEQALPHLERVRRAVAAQSFAIRAGRRPRKKPDRPAPSGTQARRAFVSVSIGVAEAASSQDILSALKGADRALYRAKDEGRNRVVLGR